MKYVTFPIIPLSSLSAVQHQEEGLGKVARVAKKCRASFSGLLFPFSKQRKFELTKIKHTDPGFEEMAFMVHLCGSFHL